ncbi:MAG: GTPase HflX, partial [Bacteroidales bacterium]|nr:GTPase HflX [Bacteroidales bacterium]
MDRAQIPSEEPTVIIGVATGIQDAARTREYLDELDFLVQTAGGRVVRRFTQNLDHPDNRTYLGSGKLQEVRDFLEENGQVHTVVFDDELSTGQIRNIEAVLTGCKVIDRTRLILDIFSTRAQTAHAKIQVELAQYEYL